MDIRKLGLPADATCNGPSSGKAGMCFLRGRQESSDCQRNTVDINRDGGNYSQKHALALVQLRISQTALWLTMERASRL